MKADRLGNDVDGTNSQGTSVQDTIADSNVSNNSNAEDTFDRAPGGESAGAKASLNPIQVVGSVFAAGLGVQSSKNRERDFKQGRAGTFIVAGLLFTALFIGTVYTVVSLVLGSR